MESDVTRNVGADRNREVDVGHRADVLRLDHGGDLGALLGRELRTRTGLTGGGGRLGRTVAILGAVHVAVAILGLHILRRTGLVVFRAHALRALALHIIVLGGFFALRAGLHVVLSALVLGAVPIHVLGLGRLRRLGRRAARRSITVHRRRRGT